jgi:hypothetical protein
VNVALWIIQGVLALAFLAAGSLKIIRPKPALAAAGQTYVEDFSDGTVKGIGVAEVLGAIGIVLPQLIGVAPVLTPIAAAGLTIVMAGAVVTHVRRKEQFVPPLVLGVLALFVAVLRFGIYPS